MFIITLFPTYLKEVHDTPLATRAFYQGLPLYAGILGMVAGGWLSDLGMRRCGHRWGRAMPIAAGRVLVGLAYVGCLLQPDPISITVLMCLVALASDLGTAPVWAWTQDVGGRHVGSVMGWANMWGNFGAALAPWIFTKIRGVIQTILQQAGQWYLLCARQHKLWEPLPRLESARNNRLRGR